MKLTNEMKDILLNWGYPQEDLEQIEEATSKTIYTYENKRIGQREAINLLGIETFLSGISRSAFHWTSSREVGNTGKFVSFDSSKLFR